MSKNYRTVKDYLEGFRKEFVSIAAGLLIGFFVFAPESQAVSAPLQNNRIETAADEPIIMEPVKTSKSGSIEISLKSNVQTTEEKMNAAYRKLNLDASDLQIYSPIYNCLRNSLKNVSIEKISADIDSDSQSLEFVFQIGEDLLVSVSKPYETMSDNNAIVTFICQHEIVYSDLADLSTLSSHINSIEKNLNNEVNAE